MKVFLGKYTNFIGPYQIAEMLLFWLDKDNEEHAERIHNLGSKLAENPDGTDTRLTRICQWVQNKKKRVEFVHIDKYDVWGMDHTLALIIHPMLLKLKTQKHGYGFIDNKDVPKELRSTARGARQGINNKWDWDNYAEARYSWMMDELIWTFEQLTDENATDKFYDHSESSKEKDFNKSIQKLKVDQVGLQAHEDRIANGLRLFGKYFRTLWD